MVVPPPPLAALHDERSSQLLGVRPHAVEAAAALGVVVGEAHAVVRDGQPDVVGLEVELDLDPAGPGVHEGIGQRVVRYGEETGSDLRGRAGVRSPTATSWQGSGGVALGSLVTLVSSSQSPS